MRVEPYKWRTVTDDEMSEHREVEKLGLPWLAHWRDA